MLETGTRTAFGALPARFKTYSSISFKFALLIITISIRTQEKRVTEWLTDEYIRARKESSRRWERVKCWALIISAAPLML
jgi:hypothetical protein